MTESTPNIQTSQNWREKLREQLDSSHYDYKELSIRSGNSEAYVSRVLTGKINPTVERLERICSTAGIKISTLFEDDSRGNTTEYALNNPKTLALSGDEALLVERLLRSLTSD